MAIEAIRAQDRCALVSPGWAELALIDDRADCFCVGEVNQQALFARMAAVVHHGGAGTTTTAAVLIGYGDTVLCDQFLGSSWLVRGSGSRRCRVAALPGTVR